jgi:HD-GYP domain-containing protein (c-di-GMP phosphodiesterase class II)
MPEQQLQARPQAAAERGICLQCGAHLVCTAGLATVGGVCGVCGGTETAPLERRNPTRSGRHFAVASVAEFDLLSDSGYGCIVLDRLAGQTAEVLGADQICIFARDRRDPAMRIVVAAHGMGPDSIGKRVQLASAVAPTRTATEGAVELRWEGELQGTLSVADGATARDFTPRELDVVRSLGTSAAAALAHAYARPRVFANLRAPIRRLAKTLEDLDAGTAEHSRDVVTLACEVGEACGFSRAGLTELGVAALLHDIGKIRVPDSILNKPGKLSAGEREVIARHPVHGAETLTRVAGLEVVATLVRYHHEHWDGGGYPDGLSGPRIPRASRIISVCDAYSAMISERPYQRAMSHSRALAELRACAGGQFDPEIVEQLEAVHAQRSAA